jgi:hypothetical protein
MPTNKPKDLARYLVEASRASLGEFYLERLSRVAAAERDIGERLHALVEDLAWVRLAHLLREHGEELVEALGSPRRRRLR